MHRMCIVMKDGLMAWQCASQVTLVLWHRCDTCARDDGVMCRVHHLECTPSIASNRKPLIKTMHTTKSPTSFDKTNTTPSQHLPSSHEKKVTAIKHHRTSLVLRGEGSLSITDHPNKNEETKHHQSALRDLFQPSKQVSKKILENKFPANQARRNHRNQRAKHQSIIHTNQTAKCNH